MPKGVMKGKRGMNRKFGMPKSKTPKPSKASSKAEMMRHEAKEGPREEASESKPYQVKEKKLGVEKHSPKRMKGRMQRKGGYR